MYRVLLVDDEQIERMALAKKIDRYYGDKVEIYHAVNGREAVAMCGEQKNDIVIMDISMPEMNGVMAAKYIRKMDDECSIIFLSAYDDFEYARNAIKVRALDYLLKPCDMNDLLAVMDTALQKLDKENVFNGNSISGKEQNKETEICGSNANNVRENRPKRTDNVRNSDEQTTIKYLKEYVENNYIYDISMQEAAEEMGYSDAYFSKLFKQYFNQNFTAYLTEYRIKKAKELLSNTNHSIKDISRMVGYTDSNYFAKIFKRLVGEIPSKYRENLTENE
ncbi:response regulator [Lachnospira pectinoschiza]|uniref:response regulator transcription factor n=1 Tax=Lachnospira pectinoschiza TaxID=28052 RepID=UPI001D068B61|nr:response regulator [Lachnospira pectinoschiza]MCB6143192.1 response regulator [Lachnospira pectinoschiza]